MMFRLLTVALLLSATNAFAPLIPSFKSVVGVTSAASSTTALPVLLTDDEVDAILKSGNDCVGSECSVDEVSNLVSELKGQQSQMEERLKKISKMIADLEEVSNKKNRDKDEVKAFVKDMLRVFERGPKQYASGFTGDVGDGPTTAYDALPPKKWKPN